MFHCRVLADLSEGARGYRGQQGCGHCSCGRNASLFLLVCQSHVLFGHGITLIECHSVFIPSVVICSKPIVNACGSLVFQRLSHCKEQAGAILPPLLPNFLLLLKKTTAGLRYNSLQVCNSICGNRNHSIILLYVSKGNTLGPLVFLVRNWATDLCRASLDRVGFGRSGLGNSLAVVAAAVIIVAQNVA